MEILLREHLWLGLIIWVALFISDYSFTIACARLYHRGVNEKIVFEGSYELTPYYQKDIDSLKRLSPRFLLALVLMIALLSSMWFLARLIEAQEIYSLVLGAAVLLQMAIHKRHLQNFVLFRSIMRSDGVRGRIEYARPLILRQSSIELLTFAAMFAILALLTWSVFVLGGVLGCTSAAVKHWRLSQQAAKRAAATA